MRCSTKGRRTQEFIELLMLVQYVKLSGLDLHVLNSHWLTRRLRIDLTETYKIVTGKETVQKGDFFVFSDTGYNLRGHCYKFVV